MAGSAVGGVLWDLDGTLVDSNDAQRHPEVDTTLNAARMPKAIRVTLTVKEGEKPVQFSTTVVTGT